MKKSRGVAARLSVCIFLFAMLLLFALIYYNFTETQKTLKNAAERVADGVSSSLNLEISRVAGEIENTALAVSKYSGFSSQWVLYKDSVEAKRLYTTLGDQLIANPNILGIGVLIDPHSWEETQGEAKHAPFVVRSGDSYAITDLADFNADYLNSGIYSTAKERNSPVWGNPFFVSEINIGSVTCAYPFKSGVVLCDVNLNWLKEATDRLNPPYGGGIVVKTLDSRILTDTAGVGKNADFPAPGNNGDISEIAVDGGKYIFYTTLSEKTGWLQTVVFPLESIIEIAKKSTISLSLAGLIGVLLLSALTYMLSMPVSKAVMKLNQSVLAISGGGLDSEVAQIHGAPGEIETLSESLNAMKLSLKGEVEMFKENWIEIEEKRCEAEIAESIRNGYLKKTFPDDPKYSLVAKLDDASGIGGDFYDFIPTDRGSLCLAVGKAFSPGVIAPAVSNSLLSYLRAILRGGQSPAVALNILAESFDRGDLGNFKEADIRLILVEFYPSTGTCTLANAGVNRPILIRGKDASFLDISEGTPISSEHRSFATGIFNFAKDDRVLFYTGTFDKSKTPGDDDEQTQLSSETDETFGGSADSADSAGSANNSDSPDALFAGMVGMAEMKHQDNTVFMLLHYK